MSPITSIGIWSLSLKIWFKSVAAETHYHKKVGSAGAGPGVETCSLSAAPQVYMALLGDSVSQHVWKMKTPSALQTLQGRDPNPCHLVPCRKHIWGEIAIRWSVWIEVIYSELHVDSHSEHSQHWHYDRGNMGWICSLLHSLWGPGTSLAVPPSCPLRVRL